jgi:glycosyltransferase involved in cell wall biosynthesis
MQNVEKTSIGGNEKPRCLYFLETLRTGGAENYIVNVANALCEKGFQQWIVYRKDGPLREKVDRRIHLVNLKPYKKEKNLLKIFSYFLQALKLYKLAKKCDIKIALVIGIGGISIPGVIFLKLTGCKIITLIPFAYKVSFKPRYIYLKFALVRYFLYNLIDKFMSFCRFQTNEFINYWRIPRNKIFCNYLGIDTETFRPMNEEMKSSLRSEFSLEPDTPILGIVARLYPVKGVHKAIEILPPIKKEIPNVKLFIVGDGPLRTVYERMVREKGLEDSVTFTGERHDIPKLMNLFDLYLQTTDCPLLGVSALEALATAKPIATFVRNEKEERMAQETVIEGVNGIILRLGSPEDVRKLIALLKDREKLKNMGYSSRKLAEEKFNFTSHIENLEKLFTKLVGDDE